MTEEKIHIETLPNGFSFTLICVEGGEFDMGGADEEALNREKPVHRVQVDTFYLGKFPVTQALWKAVMGEENNPSRFKGDQRPLEMASRDDIVNNFLPELNRITELARPQGTIYCLPTEAQWEYAARGGPYKNSYRYAGSNKLKEVGWYDENSRKETKPVGLKDPNELGLHDMSGNVYEWCLDRFDENYYAACNIEGTKKNPRGPEMGLARIIRGGGYLDFARHCRVSYRSNRGPGIRNDSIGFRLALSCQLIG